MSLMKMRGQVVRAQAMMAWGEAPQQILAVLSREMGSLDDAQAVVKQAISEQAAATCREAGLHVAVGVALIAAPLLALAALSGETGLVASPTTPGGLAAVLSQVAGVLIVGKAGQRFVADLRYAVAFRG